MNSNLRIVLAGLLTAAIVLAPAAGIAQEKPKTPPPSKAETKPAPSVRTIPFRGTVTVVDQATKTVTVGERVFQITSETKVMKSDQPATLGDVKVGDAIAGNYLKGDDGKLTAKMIRFGPKPEPTEKPAKPAKPAKPEKSEGKQAPAQPEKE